MKGVIIDLLILSLILLTAAVLVVLGSGFAFNRARIVNEAQIGKHNQCIVDNRSVAYAKEYCDVLVYGKVIR